MALPKNIPKGIDETKTWKEERGEYVAQMILQGSIETYWQVKIK